MEGPVDPNGGLITCHQCGKPLARRKGIGKFAYLNKQGREHIPVDFDSDNIKISCRDCGAGNIYVAFHEQVTVKEDFSAHVDKDVDRQSEILV